MGGEGGETLIILANNGEGSRGAERVSKGLFAREVCVLRVILMERNGTSPENVFVKNGGHINFRAVVRL